MPIASSPRWFWHAPSERIVTEFLRAQDGAAVSYPEVGHSLGGTPQGYTVDHNRIQIGRGERDFAAACDALREWRMFPSPWTIIAPADAPLRVGTVVAMQARAHGLWWLNACRVVYELDDQTPVRRFGFAYGTLPAHVEQGEERFSIELQADGAVWYDIRAFSRPSYWLVKLGKPLARRLQRRFVRESLQTMREAVVQQRT